MWGRATELKIRKFYTTVCNNVIENFNDFIWFIGCWQEINAWCFGTRWKHPLRMEFQMLHVFENMFTVPVIYVWMKQLTCPVVRCRVLLLSADCKHKMATFLAESDCCPKICCEILSLYSSLIMKAEGREGKSNPKDVPSTHPTPLKILSGMTELKHVWCGEYIYYVLYAFFNWHLNTSGAGLCSSPPSQLKEQPCLHLPFLRFHAATNYHPNWLSLLG